jgi:hypothetical protein
VKAGILQDTGETRIGKDGKSQKVYRSLIHNKSLK